ncbi:MAG: anti-anti-sigma factor [Ilumatobacteraceae bacterium]|nr:anti-anti-sigma factor [Ilumatobacteraceae bacterium]
MTEQVLQLLTAAGNTDEPHVYRVSGHGEIDIATAPQLDTLFDDLLERGARIVIFDARGVGFVDSCGLRSIIGAGNRLSAAGGQLLIEGMSGSMQRVLEVSGLLERYRSGS